MHIDESLNRAVLDNPDLPASFVAECLKSLAEPREDSTPFVPRSQPESMRNPVPADPNDPSTWGPLTPATKRLNDLIGINPKPRQLTAYEIELLRQSKREIAERAFATLTRASKHKLVPKV